MLYMFWFNFFQSFCLYILHHDKLELEVGKLLYHCSLKLLLGRVLSKAFFLASARIECCLLCFTISKETNIKNSVMYKKTKDLPLLACSHQLDLSIFFFTVGMFTSLTHSLWMMWYHVNGIIYSCVMTFLSRHDHSL